MLNRDCRCVESGSTVILESHANEHHQRERVMITVTGESLKLICSWRVHVADTITVKLSRSRGNYAATLHLHPAGESATNVGKPPFFGTMYSSSRLTARLMTQIARINGN